MKYEDFLKIANEKHNNKFTYTPFINISSKKKVEICCAIHGTFFQKINNHLRGSGCKKCSKINHGKVMTKGGEYYTRKIIEKYGDKYTFNLSKEQKSSDKISIICPIHGEFITTPTQLLRGKGCNKCVIIEVAKNQRKL